MKLLLIESAPGNAAAIGTHLAAEGHEVLTCTDETGGPCRGVAEHKECPLESHVDLAILTRQHGSGHTLNEMGSVCASRHRVPLVEIDPSEVDDEMPSVAVAGALATRRVEASYATAVRHELDHVPAIVEVHRTPARVHVTVQVPESFNTPTKISAIADRARHAIRSYDPFVQGIEVSVLCYPDAAGLDDDVS